MSTINVNEVKGVQVIEIAGRMDGELATEVGMALDEVLSQGHEKLVLDLGSVDYISSPGLREIVRAYKRAQANGGDLRIANPSERVMDVFKLAGLDTTLRIYRSDAQAIASF
jgi:anti-sigma B factor antagonist